MSDEAIEGSAPKLWYVLRNSATRWTSVNT